MKVLLGVLLLVCAVYADSGYADVRHGGYLDLKSPYKGCHYVGQYLKHPKDECKFLVCDYGNEPWKDEHGKILLFAREMRCANGISVGYGYEHGYENPCNTPNKKCFVYPKEEKKGYHEVDTKAVYHSYDDHENGYRKNHGYNHHNHGYDNKYDQGYDSYGKKDQGYEGYNTYNTYNTYNRGYDNKGYDNKGYDNKGYDNKGYEHQSHGGYDNKHQGYDSYQKKDY